MSGGCWSYSFCISGKICCSLKDEEPKLTVSIFRTNTYGIIWWLIIYIINIKNSTYRLSCEHRRHKTWASCSSGPWICGVCHWPGRQALKEVLVPSPPPPLPPHIWNRPADPRDICQTKKPNNKDMIELLYKLLLKFLNVKHTELPVSMSHSIMKYYISVLPCLFISWYLISVLHLAFQDLVNNISMSNPDQPAVLSFFP